MTTYTTAQQTKHRIAFIEGCYQEAWASRCRADWMSLELDKVLKEYQRLQEEDRTLEADIKELESALDYHTVENRQKRKAMQEKRNSLAGVMPAVLQNYRQGMGAMQQLLHTVEASLDVAKHAETWGWKEVEAKPEEHEKAA